MPELFSLVSAEERHAESPDTFQIPSREEREGLCPGDHVKIIFETATGRPERMWVRVEDVGEDCYLGSIANKPAFIPPHVLKFGDEIVFGPEHVASILENETTQPRLRLIK